MIRLLRPNSPLLIAAGWAAVVAGTCAGADLTRWKAEAAAATPAQRPSVLLLYSAEAEFTNPKLALQIAQQALEASQSSADRIRSRTRVAASERALGDYTNAMAHAQASLADASAAHDDRLRAQAMLVIARTQWGLSQLPDAIATFRQMLEIAAAQQDIPTEIDGYAGLGIALGEVGDHEKGRQQFQLALDLANQSGDSARRGNALTDLGNTALAAGDIAVAQSYHERARQAFMQAGNTWGRATALVNLGSVAEISGDLATALTDVLAARDIYRKLGLKRQWANAERQLGSVLSKLGREDESRAAFKAGLDLGRSIHSHTVMANLYLEQGRAQERAHDYAGALQSERQYGAEHEASLGEKSRGQMAELNARFDAEHREKEIVNLRSAQVAHAASELQSRTRAYELGALLIIGALTATLVVGWQRITLLAQRRVAAEAHVAREAAEQADRVKTRLLGIASHDLKGPLGNIQQIAEELQAEQPKDAARDERLDWVKVETLRLTRLVQDLLDTAALETGRLELRSAPLDLAEVVDAVVTELQWQLQEKRQRVFYDQPAAGVAQVVGDEDRLRQLVGNIVGNAVKFSPTDGAITLVLARRGDRVILTVADEGPGLTAEDRERIFAPFSRLSAQPTGREMSHGLGLSIAQEIVRLHGGAITVDSEPGRGAAFRIELPAAV